MLAEDTLVLRTIVLFTFVQRVLAHRRLVNSARLLRVIVLVLAGVAALALALADLAARRACVLTTPSEKLRVACTIVSLFVPCGAARVGLLLPTH